MSSLREYRKKIKTVKSIRQITKAMKMIAVARLRKAQSQILSARPFAIKMRELLSDLSWRSVPSEKDFPLPHPLLESHVSSNKIAVLLVTADKGLCGSFNTNLIKKASEYLKENENKDIRFYIAGKKGRDFFRRLGYPLAGEYVNIFNSLSYAHAEVIGKDLIDVYVNEKVAEVVLIYNEFKSVLQQNLVIEKLLPVVRSVPERLGNSLTEEVVRKNPIDFIYEPAKEKLLGALLPRCVKSQIFRVLLESAAAELGARMTAMDSATKNAVEMIDDLILKLNRTRQAIITREIAELVGGAEALT